MRYFPILLNLILIFSIKSYTNILQYQLHLNNFKKNFTLPYISPHILQLNTLANKFLFKNNKSLQIFLNTVILSPILLNDNKEVYQQIDNLTQDTILSNLHTQQTPETLSYYIFKAIASNINYFKKSKNYLLSYNKHMIFSTLSNSILNPLLLSFTIQTNTFTILPIINYFIYDNIVTLGGTLYCQYNNYRAFFKAGIDKNIIDNKKIFFTQCKALNIFNYNNIIFFDGEIYYKYKNTFSITPYIRLHTTFLDISVGCEYKYTTKHAFNPILKLNINLPLNINLSQNTKTTPSYQINSSRYNSIQPNKHIQSINDPKIYKQHTKDITIKELNDIPIKL